MDRLENGWQGVMSWFRLSEEESLASLILSLVGTILLIMMALALLFFVIRAIRGRRSSRRRVSARR